MTILIIALLVLGIVTFFLEKLWESKKDKEERAAKTPEINSDAECCGQHEVCEKESLLSAVSKEIEYYDDEELDVYRGRPSEEYTQEETEEFRSILYTMRSDEVAGWIRSLQLRSVELPEGLRDEVLLIVGERRGL